ncbi:MAG: hypothetical protein JW973_06180 [Bacteroidales bacterium]|nr:hypothetical protein [Bacteroidales bacterium]
MHKLSGVIGFFLIPLLAYTQGEIDTQEKILYRNERSLALLLNSNGFGGNFRYAKRVTYLKKTLYEVDLVSIKHPKEVRIYTNTSVSSASKSYIYGKTNSFINLRGGIGFQREIYQKQDRGGIAIRYFYSFGPDIGLAKPVYYNYISVLYVDGQIMYSYSVEKFKDQHVNPTEIIGRASYFKGFDEISVIPGIFGKVGLTMEFGRSEKIVNALEGGLIADIFIKKVPIMATEDNNWLFFSLFLSYRFGKAIDVSKRQRKKTKIDELLVQ